MQLVNLTSVGYLTGKVVYSWCYEENFYFFLVEVKKIGIEVTKRYDNLIHMTLSLSASFFATRGNCTYSKVYCVRARCKGFSLNPRIYARRIGRRENSQDMNNYKKKTSLGGSRNCDKVVTNYHYIRPNLN